MAQAVFFRNSRSADQLETFLVSGAASVLGIRFYLHLTDYPQVGGERFHIAHMLYGGLLMMAALVIALGFLGPRLQRVVAIVGGIGFGFFIDELGKFITRDNDYFYSPTIGLIYATFIVLYLGIHFIGRTRPLSSREYQVNALWQLQEAAVEDMDEVEKARVRSLLAGADQANPLTKELKRLLERVPTVATARGGIITRSKRAVRDWYAGWINQKHSRRLIQVFFIAEGLVFFLSVAFAAVQSLAGSIDVSSGMPVAEFRNVVAQPSYAFRLVIAELTTTALAALFIVIGAISFTRSRLRAYEWFHRAILINLFLTEFFTFTRVQFAALPGFAFNLAILVLIRFAIQHERSYRETKSRPVLAGNHG